MNVARKLMIGLTGAAIAGSLTFGAMAFANGHGGGHGRGAGGDHGKEFMSKIDTDGNGSISTAESTAFFAARAGEIDLNKDGAITSDEIRTHHQAMRKQREDARLARLDTNKDGKVSTAEFATEQASWILSRDADGNGEVAPEEMHRGGRHHGPG